MAPSIHSARPDQKCAYATQLIGLILMYILSVALIVSSGIALNDALDIKNNKLPELIALISNVTVIKNDCLSCDIPSATLTMDSPVYNEIPSPYNTAVQFTSGDLSIGMIGMGYGASGQEPIDFQRGPLVVMANGDDSGSAVFGKCSTFNKDCSDVDTDKYKGSYGIGVYHASQTSQAERCNAAKVKTVYQVIVGTSGSPTVPNEYYLCTCVPVSSSTQKEYCTETDSLISAGLDWDVS